MGVVDIEDAVPWRAAHARAEARGDATYTDPSTGYVVFTARGLRRQGKCCGNGCRHCPYAHFNVRDAARRTALPTTPERLSRTKPKKTGRPAAPLDVVLWCGSTKDDLAGRTAAVVVFEERTGRSVFGGGTLHDAVEAARAEGADVLCAPWTAGGDSVAAVRDALLASGAPSGTLRLAPDVDLAWRSDAVEAAQDGVVVIDDGAATFAAALEQTSAAA